MQVGMWEKGREMEVFVGEAQQGTQHRGSRRVDPTRTRATKGPPGTGLAHKDGQRPLCSSAFRRGHQYTGPTGTAIRGCFSKKRVCPQWLVYGRCSIKIC